MEILIIVAISFLGPILGSLIGVLQRPSKKIMYNMLAFAGGVMLAISFLQLIPESIELSSIWITVLGILFGSTLMFGVDKLIPHIHPELCQQEQGRKIERTSLYLIMGIFMHNFPEGKGVFVGLF